MADDTQQRLERLEEQLARLTDGMLRLEEHMGARLEGIATDAALMARHVGFVESVYERVKRPFFFLMGAVDRHAPALRDTTAQPQAALAGPSRCAGDRTDDSSSNTVSPSISSSS